MLTGKVPFEADTPVSVALKHLQEMPKEPIKLNPSIPLAVNNIIMKAMKKDPNLRYQSATEMLRDLTLALKNPDGNFVNTVNADEDFATQVIPTLDKKNIEDKIKEEDKKKNKKDNFFKKYKAFTIAIVLILLFVLSFAGMQIFFNATRNKDIQVPNLVGMTEEKAKETIKGTKLQYKIVEEKYDVEVEKGLIISQKPEFKSDFKIKENTIIEVVVSLGQKIVKVPKVTGLKENDARDALGNEDLDVEIEEEFNKKIEEGYVISQETEPNTEVPAGTKIKIKVSKGIEKAVVPNVVGKPKDEAVEMLTKDGMFTITATLTEQDTTKADGTILKQSLDAGTEQEKGANITITVNQIEKIVDATATINLKSVMNYDSQNTNTSTNTMNNGVWNTTTDPQGRRAQVKLVVGNDTVYNQTHKISETNINVKFSGIGTVAVKLYVDDVWKDTKQINLSTTNTVTFE